MDRLRRHEIFEIEVLERLNSLKLLSPLIFGGGTMLRLCWGLKRYSFDLDFWFLEHIDADEYFQRINEGLLHYYEITDSKSKYYSFLIELRSPDYQSRLKIEIRKEIRQWDVEQRIAYSPYSTKQVAVRVHTLQQTIENKIAAAIDRKQIRDFFDIEFLLRQGISLPNNKDVLRRLERIARSFNKRDYRVSLGSLLEKDMRDYYVKHGFDFLLAKINEALSNIERQ